ncbi:ferredoxin [Halobacteriales archaeon QS_8_69_26]|nr:MAG: ferredoxin [Halobacteriales archaeon QS_8_69_26]
MSEPTPDDSEAEDGSVRVGTTEEVIEDSPMAVPVNGTAVAVFHHEDGFHAVDNRCPHMGFPLTEGTVEDGILTCHWHHARFEISCGNTFDPWADDVPNYPVEVRDGDVYVGVDPQRDLSPAERWAERLETGMEENLDLVVAKSVIGLDDAGVAPEEPIRTGVEFGTTYREDGWSSGLTILGCMANVLDDLRPEDRRRALFTGLRHVASDCAGEPPRFGQPALEVDDAGPERLKKWFRENVEVRDADGAERVLRTAVETCDREAVEEMLFAAATDHIYLNTGHTLDFVNKAVETLDHVGWDRADDALASLVTSLTGATRSEELSSWRQPVDLAEILFDAYEDLDDMVAEGEGREWTPPEGFDDTLLSDDPHDIVDALTTAVREGATTTELADRVCHAAATRVAQFGTSNEFSDWNTVHHTFTYANAVRQATRRTDATELYRGVFDAATNVYLDRFLNTPPAPIPEPGETDRDPDAILDDLLETFDQEGEVDTAGSLVGEFFDAGGEMADLKATMGRGLLREDAGFHTLQAVEAGFAQYEAAETDHDRRVAMVAPARYMAAHFPTRREAEQTFTIAERLNSGEAVHE